MPDKPPALKDFIKDKSDGEYTYVKSHLRRLPGGGGGDGGDGCFETIILGTFFVIILFIYVIIPAAKSFFSIFWFYVYWLYLIILLVISVRLVVWVYKHYRKRNRKPLPWPLMIVLLLALMFFGGFWFLTWFWQNVSTGHLYSYGCLGTILIILGVFKLYQRRKRKKQMASEGEPRIDIETIPKPTWLSMSNVARLIIFGLCGITIVALSVYFWHTNKSNTALTSTPVITNVSSIYPTQTQTITIRGQGFGQHNPYNGNSEYISVSDLTRNWSAGYLGSAVTLNVTSWSDTKIVISGFTGQYGKQGWVLYSGDSIQITLWVTPDSTRPVTYKTTVSH